MVRVLNTLCVALMGLSILGLYHVSERTRVARVELHQVAAEIAREQATMSVLQTEWERVAGPAQIQALAENHLGLSGAPAVQLSSFDLLPRRGEDPAPLANAPIRQANAQVPAPEGTVTQPGL
jgi:cell division protein FtsL